ncbi:hypothetical protein [Emticicia sp. 17c]|uniref:hypothetical protein n=1 Tax=Emticicia sp. 17c TaxID=3127704 RepID=UPI00301D4F7C
MKESIKITELPKVNIFKVPEGYFDTLAVVIHEKIGITQDPAINFGKKQSFQVPENYFDTLSAKILNRIAVTEQARITLDTLEKANIFTVPEGYFEVLEEQIQTNIWIESFERKNIFEVPENYFEKLPETILEKTHESKVIKVNWWQKSRTLWSAAASVVLLVGLGFAIPQMSQPSADAAFNEISQEELNSYLATQDLSYLEYEVSASPEKPLPKEIETKILDDLKIDNKDILEHLENENLEDI